jgi:hypothetical protein
MMKKYLVSFIPFPRGNESHRQTHEFETSAQPGTFSFWYHVHSTFSGTTEKLEWVEL